MVESAPGDGASGALLDLTGCRLIVFRISVCRINLTLFRHFIACQVFVVSRNLVNHFSVRKDFHDAVGGSLHNLVVVGGEEQHAGEFNQAVVQSRDRFHI